jgi:hypothetical protein
MVVAGLCGKAVVVRTPADSGKLYRWPVSAHKSGSQTWVDRKSPKHGASTPLRIPPSRRATIQPDPRTTVAK